MARRIVDYVFRVSKDNVGPRFKSFQRSQRTLVREGRRDWNTYERNAKRSLSNISKHGKHQFKNIGKRAGSLTGKLTALFALLGVSAVTRKSVGALASLESQMVGLAIKLDTPLEKLKGLRREIEDFSTIKGIEQGANEIGKLLNNAVGFGLELKPALALVKEIARASSATHSNASILMGGALIAFGARPELLKDPKTAIGKLLVASDIGGIEIEDSAPALGATTAPAQKAKISFEEQLALLAALSTTGVDKPQVGTAIAQMLNLITRTSFRKGARKIGVNVIDDKNQLKSAIEIINLVGNKFRTLKSQPRQQKVLNALFGVGNVRAERGFLPFFEEVKKLRGNVKKINVRGPLQVDKAMMERLKELDARLDRIRNNTEFIVRDLGNLLRGPIERIEEITGAFVPKKGEKTLSERALNSNPKEGTEGLGVPGGASFLGSLVSFLIDPVNKKIVEFIQEELKGSSGQKNVSQLNFLDSDSSTKQELANKATVAHPTAGFKQKIDLNPSAKQESANNLIVVKPTIEFKPKININQKINAATGKTQTDVAITDPTDLQRRVPLGATP